MAGQTQPAKLDIEKAAMTGDRRAVLQVISDLRKYRTTVANLLANKRHGDGSVDGVDMTTFASAVEEIEDVS